MCSKWAESFPSAVTVVQPSDSVLTSAHSGIDHRLNGNGHARQQAHTSSRCAVIGYAWIFMQLRAYSVADKGLVPPSNRALRHTAAPHCRYPLSGSRPVPALMPS